MLAFLHTAEVHIDTFEHLARELDCEVPIRHDVQAGLLASALAAGATTSAVRLATNQAVSKLALQGARVIVCTCSTIGAVAEEARVAEGVRVVRIDRAMAELAVAHNRRIVVFATVQSTLEPTVALLHQVALAERRPIEVTEVLCERAWPLFEAGDHSGYLNEIVSTIETRAQPGQTIVLAQASMASAAERLGHLGTPVLSSPRLGVEAALALYRAKLSAR